MKAAGDQLAADVRIACGPMVRDQRLQKDDTIRNPYHGSAMLTCGDVKK